MSTKSSNWTKHCSYVVTLSMPHAKKAENGNYLVTFDGEEKEIKTNKFIFYTPSPVNYEQALKRIEGTKGVYSVEGNFRDKQFKPH
jgi:hypothetical protein